MKAPYGSWKSPVTTDLIVAECIGLGGSQFVGDTLYWMELRPQEGGRAVLVRREADGSTTDLYPAPFYARTRVHEYGGGAWLIGGETLFFSNFSDQQLYVQELVAADTPRKLTDEPDFRFANATVDEARDRLICVVEDHGAEGEPENFIGAVDLVTGNVTRLVAGHDFFSSPTLSPDGDKLAWVAWDHPNMPWDHTSLWLADLDENGIPLEAKLVAGDNEAVQQPRFSPGGALHFITDRNGWWNIYRHENETICICQKEAEFAGPPWDFGVTSFHFRSEQEILCLYSNANQTRLATLDATTGQLDDVELPFTSIGGLSVSDKRCTFIGASPTRFSAIVTLNLDTHEMETIKESCKVILDTGYYSVPEAIEFDTANNETAHGFYYPPANKDYEAPAGDFPPLVVMVHGGPTASTSGVLSLSTQFWTSRGFAVLDLNYRGSTGYGRTYRQRLNGAWGIVDVEDSVHGARYLAERRLADPDMLAIRGGSAGGYTTLAALTFEDTFKAGASYYGIGDLEALAKDTHKFESRYVDSMIGRYPEDIGTYKSRSPINHVDRLSCPVIFFQGLEDKIVPPNQAETMVAALKEKNIPVAYVPFEGEQHGFRKAENIKRSLDLELFFYAKIFGFSTADQIEPVDIMNLPP